MNTSPPKHHDELQVEAMTRWLFEGAPVLPSRSADWERFEAQFARMGIDPVRDAYRKQARGLIQHFNLTLSGMQLVRQSNVGSNLN